MFEPKTPRKISKRSSTDDVTDHTASLSTVLRDAVRRTLFGETFRRHRRYVSALPSMPPNSGVSIEPLEKRLLLSADLLPGLYTDQTDGAAYSAPTAVLTASVASTPASRAANPQIVYLDLDGAEDVDIDGTLLVDASDVPEFVAPAHLAGQEPAILDAMMAALSAEEFGIALDFTTERPAGGSFATVQVGGDGSGFAEASYFLGLAESVDVGNRDTSDVAFVFAERIYAGGLTAEQFGQQLAQAIAHEVGHLIGEAHDEHDTAGRSALAAVALDVDIPATVKEALIGADGLSGGLKLLVDKFATLAQTTVLQTKIPGLEKSFAELLQLSETIEERLRTPITALFNTPGPAPKFSDLFAIIESVVPGSTEILASSNSDDGLAFEVEFDFAKIFNSTIRYRLNDGGVGLGLSVDASLDVEAVIGFVDAATQAVPTFAFGVDLRTPTSPGFYIKAETLALSAEVHTTTLAFAASLGFLSVGIENGVLDLEAAIEVDLTALDSGGDGFITSSDLTSNFGSLAPVLGGTLSSTLPVFITGLPGLDDDADPTTGYAVGSMTVDAPDLFDLGTYTFTENISDDVFGAGISFDNITAADIVSAIGRLADSLDDMRDQGLLNGLDIPLIGGVADTVLNFANVVSEGLLYDPGDDGEKDGANRFASDLNAALATAGLDTSIIVTGNGADLRFQVIDPTITGIKIAADASDTGGFALLGFDAGAGTTASQAHIATPTGLATADTKIKITIERDGASPTDVIVTLTSDAVADNDDFAKLAADLNDMLAAASLDAKLRARAVGNQVRLELIDDSYSGFNIAVSPGDAGGFARLGIPAAAATTASRVHVATPTNASGSAASVLASNAGIKFTLIKNDSSTEVSNLQLAASATSDNLGIGDDSIKLLRADNSATFSTAQELAFRLETMLADLITPFAAFGPTALTNPLDLVDWDSTTKALKINVGKIIPSLDYLLELPLDFNLDLGPVGNIQSDTKIELKASVGLDEGFAIGVYLGSTVPGADGNLSDTTDLDDLNGGDGVDIGIDPSLMFPQAVISTIKQLTGDATFTITLNDSATGTTIKVPALSGVPGSDVNVTRLAGAQNEATIAINPVNPLNMIVGVNDVPSIFSGPPGFDTIWVTTDGGVIWASAQVPTPAGAQRGRGDPSIVFSSDGTKAVFTHLVDIIDPATTNTLHKLGSAVFDVASGTFIGNGIIGTMTPDEDGDTVPDNNDKEFIAVGPKFGDLSKDNFVVSWHRDGVIYVATSDDGIAWSTPAVIGGMTGTALTGNLAVPTGFSIDAIPKVGPNGEIYVIWEDASTTGIGRLMFDVSFDGGVTWGGGLDTDDRIYFDTGVFNINSALSDATRTAAQLAYLDTVATALVADRSLMVTVSGFTDAQGNAANNQTLADNRADAVADYLVSKGVNAAQVREAGFGESPRWFAVKTTDAGYLENLEANRRVELSFDRVVYTGTNNYFDDINPGLDGTDGDYEIPAQPERGIWMGLSFDVDNSTGPNRGRLYIAFVDQFDQDGSNLTGHTDTDVFVVASDNDGRTWDALTGSADRVNANATLNPNAASIALVKVNDGVGASQFFSWLDVDDSTGNLAVGWYDTRDDNDNVQSGGELNAVANDEVFYYAAYSVAGGLSWSSDIRVSDGLSSAFVVDGVHYGDYTGLVFADGTIHMTWADNSNSTGDNPGPLVGTQRQTDAYYDRIELLNQDIQDLVDDINRALGTLSTQVQAVAEGNRIVLKAADPGVMSIKLTSPQGDPAVTGIGFGTAQTARGPLIGDALDTFALNPDIGDAHFTLGIGGTDYQVTVTAASTTGFTNITQLATAVNAAIQAALPGTLDGKVVADFVGTSLRIRVVDAAIGPVAFSAAIEDSAVISLGFTNEASIVQPRLVAQRDVAQNTGRLTSDATIEINTTGGPSGRVTIYADDTATNSSVVSLVADFNKALATPTIKTGTLTSFATPNPVIFSVSINGGTAVEVTVVATGNDTLAELVEDINAALSTAGLAASVSAKSSGASSDPGKARVKFEAAEGVSSLSISAGAGNALRLATSATATSFKDEIIAESSGNRIILKAVEASGITAFTVEGITNAAPLGVGTSLLTSDSVDLEIRVSNPPGGDLTHVYRVTLDGAQTIADIKTMIAAQTNGDVTVEHTATSLRLVDTTFNATGPNLRTFSVIGANGSGAAAGLGIAGVDSTTATERDGEIEGGQISGVRLTDRFFMENVLLKANLDVSAPDGVDMSASVGFVSIDLTGTASLDAEFTLGLKDPADTTPGDDGPADDGRITLREFIDNVGNFTETLLDAPSLTGLGVLDLEVRVALGGGVEDFITLPNGGVGTLKFSTNLGDLFDRWDDVVAGVPAASPTKLGDASFTLNGDFTGLFKRSARVTIPGTGGSADYKSFVTSVTYDDTSDKTTVEVLGDLPASINNGQVIAGIVIGLPNGPSAGASAFALTTPEQVLLPDFDLVSDLGDLLTFDNLEFNFQSIIDALLLLRDLLSQIDAVGNLLDEPIPFAGVSVNDLLDYADRLSDAIASAQQNPAASLQKLDEIISGAFGLPAVPALPGQRDVVSFTLDNFGTPTDRSDDAIKIVLDLGAAFNESVSVSLPGIDLSSILPPELGSLVDFGGAATLGASGSADFELVLGIGIQDPRNIYLYGDSNLSGTLALSGTDMAFRAALGPLGLAIKDGEANINGSVDVTFDTTSPTTIFTNGRVRFGDASFSDIVGALDIDYAAPVSVTLPVYFPTDSNFIGNMTLTGNLTDIANGLFVKDETGETPPPDTLVLDVSAIADGLAGGLTDLSLLDQILFIVDGVDVVLGGVQDAMDGEILGIPMPLIGDKLKGAADVIGDFRTGFVADFRTEIEKLAIPNQDGIKDILLELLGPAGLDLLLAVDGTGAAETDGSGNYVDGGLDDITSFNNLDLPDTTLSTAEIWWKMKIGQNLVDTGADIGFDIGIPGLGLKSEGEIRLDIDWELDFGFGLSGKDGFFFFISDQDELLLTIEVTADATLSGQLAFLEFSAANEDVDGEPDDGNTHLGASFFIDIKNESDENDERLGLSELGKIDFGVELAAEASVELAMTLGIANDDGGFPQIQADFFLDWELPRFDLFDPGDEFEIGSAIQDGLKKVEFKNVSLDVGSYISDVVRPLIEDIQDFTEPVQPIIDIVTTPLPVLADLGLEITLLDIAAQTGAVSPGFITAIETIAQVITVVNSIEFDEGDANVLIPIGDFVIFENTESFLEKLGLAGFGGGSFDLGVGNFNIDKFSEAVFGPGGALADLIGSDVLDGIIGEVAGVASEIIGNLAAESGAGGGGGSPFKFDLLEDPMQVFGMLMGRPAKLITYDMPEFGIDAEFSAFFSIFGPLGVSINLEAALNIDFAFGYDTKGFTDFAATDFRNPLLLLNGFYIDDDPTPSDPSDGDDPPELTFDGGLWAAAELNLGIARGGVGGGIFIGVDFNLFDNDGDGRVRLDELLANFTNQLKAPEVAERFLAPLAVFDVTGKVTAELFAFLKIDFGFFELDKKFNITDPITLADFDVDFFRPPVLANEVEGGDLIINIGEFAEQRKLGDLTDANEQIFIESAGPGKVRVWSNLEDAGSNAKQEYSVTGKIIILAGEGDDLIDLSGVTDASLRFEIEGNEGNDRIILTKAGVAAKASGIIRGGIGNDEIDGGDGAELIFGNGGADIIRAGKGNDIVLADNGEVTDGLIHMAERHGFVRALVSLTDGIDTVDAGDGDDLVFGSGGADIRLAGDAGNDIVVGDGGLATYNSPAIVTETETGLGADDQDIRGGIGNDWLYGGKGADTMHGDAGNDVIFGESGKDKLYGDGDNDIIFGDFGRFVNGNLSDPVVTVGGDADEIYGGLGVDKLLGGGGNDLMHGDDGEATGGPDDDDTMRGGVGVDTMYGDGGDDTIFGESDDDFLYGNAGDDHLEGGAGNDKAWGGVDRDLLVAGYGSDVLDGEVGGDTYRITARGGLVTELTTIYDSGPNGGGAEPDSLVLIGTPFVDTVLLRGMADYYFPTPVRLIGDNADPTSSGLTDRIFASEDPDKLRAVLQALEDAYGPHAPNGELVTVDGASGDLAALERKIIETYVAFVRANVLTALTGQAQGLIDDVTDILDSTTGLFPGKLEELTKAIANFFGESPVPGTLLTAVSDAWDGDQVAGPSLLESIRQSIETLIDGAYRREALVGLLSIVDAVYGDSTAANATSKQAVVAKVTAVYTTSHGQVVLPAALQAALAGAAATPDALKSAILGSYDPTVFVPGLDTDTGFVALINNGGTDVERFNYRNIEGLTVDTGAGDDYVVSDDVLAATTIHLGLGADRLQIGQVFRSERVKDFGSELITGIRAEDVFTTLEITRGWLSPGVSQATTVNGGDGNDEMTVFHNTAVLNLNGGNGDDIFTVRAFALKGSTDSERARTDMKGDGGADTILYVINAPVGIDGGDGFDTVRIIGTEFADDFVVTDGGIFGGGLSVSYVNIEKLVADGAEGDDRFFVQSTGIEVVTEIDGGLGSDTFFVGGNPSGAPVAVNSNDFKGHSGIILHSIETGSDPAWSGVPIEGVSANVGDDEEDFVLVRETEGFSRVVEGAASGLGQGWYYDSYGVRLTRRPGIGQVVQIQVIQASPSTEDAAMGFQALEFLQADLTTTLGVHPKTGVPLGPVLTFTDANWDVLQNVNFRAVDDGASEGERVAFINHILTGSTDPEYRTSTMLSVKVSILDNDRKGVIVTQTGRDNVLLEDAIVLDTLKTDEFEVRLSTALATAPVAPAGDVIVKMTVLNSQIALSGPNVVQLTPHEYQLTFTAGDWTSPRTVTMTATSDATIEGFHTDFIRFTVTSTDGPTPTPVSDIAIDGDFDLLGLQPIIPEAKPTSYVLLPHRPDAGTVSVTIDGQALATTRFEVSGNTLTFLGANGFPELRTGAVRVSYIYTEAGYNGAFVKDAAVDLYDDDTPMVIVRPAADGSVDVIEGGDTDTYTIRLSKAPVGEVKIKVDAVDTRSTYGRTALFQEQVTVNGDTQTILTFNSTTWSDAQTVTVAAKLDTVFDGNDTQVFAPDLQTVNKIRGPLVVEGAGGGGSLSLPVPLMLPNELDKLRADGTVVSFAPGIGLGAFEFMTVQKSELQAVLERLHSEDGTFSTVDADRFQQFVGKTLELSEGNGTGVVLDPARPDDLFNRFWLIDQVTENADGTTITLKLQNPSIVNPAVLGGSAQPNSSTKYAITSLSVNFFAREVEQIDYLFVFENHNVSNDTGALTSSDGVVRDFDVDVATSTTTMKVELGALQAVTRLVGSTEVADLIGRRIEITVGPGLGRSWEIGGIGPVAGEADLRSITLIDPEGSPVDPANPDPTVFSEFRIAGGDTRGRITGFGMGPNILVNGRPQSGGISYGDIEVVQVSLGTGDDIVRVDYATIAADQPSRIDDDGVVSEFYTLTLLDTGGGEDVVTVNLQANDDGAFSLNLGAGDDEADGSASTAQLIVFGWDGEDVITTGDGDDIVFGDRGRVDYVSTVMTNHDANSGTPLVPIDQVITRLGHSIPLNPVNPPVSGATDVTLTDSNTTFDNSYDSLIGLSIQAISPTGRVQFRTIVGVSADGKTIEIDRPWDQIPVGYGNGNLVPNPVPNSNFFYRISAFPEDQTDGVFRGPRVAWTIDDAIGGIDTITTGAGKDIAIGGVAGDIISAGLGDDLIAGDDARIDFKPVSGNDGPTELVSFGSGIIAGDDIISSGGGNDITIGGFGADQIHGDGDDDTLVGDAAVISFAPGNIMVRVETTFNASTLNGIDTIYGDAGDDIVVGGGQGDFLRGGDGDDTIIGDAAVITLDATGLVQVKAYDADDGSEADGDDGEAVGDDAIFGETGDDLVLGGFGADIASGGADEDVMHGDVAVVTFTSGAPNELISVFQGDSRNGADTLRGDGQDDILLGGGKDDRLDGGAQDDLILGDNAALLLVPGSGRAINPRYREAVATLYDSNGNALVGPTPRQRPGSNPAWANWVITSDNSLDASRFGNDYIAGGANDDMILGQRGNDTIQGDGSIDELASAARVSGLLQIDASVEASTDGDDYIEGNAGADTIFGNLGQDDIIGGNSSAFDWSLAGAQRDDGADWITGGAGVDLARSNPGDTGTSAHARDSDMILGDNGNIFRVVAGVGATTYRTFNYDNYGGERIKVRLADLVDYTPGGPAFSAAANADRGAGDELHGESGDDFIYGMTGNDVLFGEGQDDDLIAGWGHDWISGGTGDDGVLGDDGRLMTSRNGSTEPLNGVTVATVQSTISTPGSIQVATINVTGQLKKMADLQPFGLGLDTLYDPTLADDIIYGGLGNDWLHAGWGDDAVSGAEALPEFYSTAGRVNGYDPDGGDILGYNTATGEFNGKAGTPGAGNLYDEYNPMTQITGFLLNFNADEGLVVATGFETDGDDRIFGDLGNDWLVGGTGRDTLYGGWGDDLMNADDDQRTNGGLNTAPDTHASYEDRAYGGAGRDVLIANTGGDRLIDWVGEFNSFLVPFAPFGQATVSRTLQPQLAEFLLALSKSDGADQTLGSAGDPRQGEPFGELGMVRQQDAAWQDQTGGPRDPQAGNIPGGKRDVLRSSDLNNGQLQGFAADSGTWQLSGGALQVASTSQRADAVAVYQIGDALPSYYEVQASAKVIRPTGGWEANSYVIFDYQSQTSFKFAGINVDTNKLVIGQRTATGWQVLAQSAVTGSVRAETWYNLMLQVNGLTAIITLDNRTTLSHVFQPTVVDGFAFGLNWGLVGFGSKNSRGALDNIAVQVVAPTSTVTYRDEFTAGIGSMFDTLSVGSWSAAGGRATGAPLAGSDTALNLMDLSTVTRLQTTSLLELSTTLRTAGRAGLIFDYYGSTDFKFAAIDTATKQVMIGHRTASGWTIDAALTRSTLNATTDYVLGVTVRGSSVSVTLNGQAVTAFVYNAVAIDGRFGIFAKGTSASFDLVSAKTNDGAVPAALTASTAVERSGATPPNAAELQLLAAEARRRWALIEDASHLAVLDGLEVDVADLPAGRLAQLAEGRIIIDDDAAGHGWFIDLTPSGDSEFRGNGPSLLAAGSSDAEGRMDLLTVIAHEMGHVIGLAHAEDGVMDETLAPGTRSLPDHWSRTTRFEPISMGATTSSANDSIALAAPAFPIRITSTNRLGDDGTAPKHRVHEQVAIERQVTRAQRDGTSEQQRFASSPRIDFTAILPVVQLNDQDERAEHSRPIQASGKHQSTSPSEDSGIDAEVLERLKVRISSGWQTARPTAR